MLFFFRGSQSLLPLPQIAFDPLQRTTGAPLLTHGEAPEVDQLLGTLLDFSTCYGLLLFAHSIAVKAV